MTKEEAARILDPDTTREALAAYAYDPEQRLRVVEEACRIAARELRKDTDHFRDFTKMVPLTLEQLRRMDIPTPVWAEVEGKTIEGWNGYWCLCQNGKVLAPSRIIMQADQIEEVTFYQYLNEHIDRKAWEKPCKICNGEKTVYQDIDSTKLYMEKFGGSIMLVTEVNACPPYADCSKKEIYTTYAFQINYCPECGRPLTHEGRKALEKRFGEYTNEI